MFRANGRTTRLWIWRRGDMILLMPMVVCVVGCMPHPVDNAASTPGDTRSSPVSPSHDVIRHAVIDLGVVHRGESVRHSIWIDRDVESPDAISSYSTTCECIHVAIAPSADHLDGHLLHIEFDGAESDDFTGRLSIHVGLHDTSGVVRWPLTIKVEVVDDRRTESGSPPRKLRLIRDSEQR